MMNENFNYSLVKKIDELKLIRSKLFKDARGYFNEYYNLVELKPFLTNFTIKQASISVSKKNVFRGMHFQLSPKISKVTRLISGKAIFFAIDMSKLNNQRVIAIKIEKDPSLLIYTPYYYARGFISLSNNTVIEYLQGGSYEPKNEFKVKYPNLNALKKYSKSKLIISDKDQNATTISEWYKKYYYKFFK